MFSPFLINFATPLNGRKVVFQMSKYIFTSELEAESPRLDAKSRKTLSLLSDEECEVK